MVPDSVSGVFVKPRVEGQAEGLEPEAWIRSGSAGNRRSPAGPEAARAGAGLAGATGTGQRAERWRRAGGAGRLRGGEGAVTPLSSQGASGAAVEG